MKDKKPIPSFDLQFFAEPAPGTPAPAPAPSTTTVQNHPPQAPAPTAPKPVDFNLGDWLKEPTNFAAFAEVAEKTVSLPLKQKVSQFESENKSLKSKLEELTRGQEGNQQPGTAQDGKKYTDADVAKMINSRETEWNKNFDEERNKLQAQISRSHNFYLDSALTSGLTSAGAKPETVEILKTYLKNPYPNGQQKFQIEDAADGSIKVSVYDQDGKPKVSKSGLMSIPEFILEMKGTLKDFFKPSDSGGSGAAGSGGGSGLMPGKITQTQYANLPPQERAKYLPADIVRG